MDRIAACFDKAKAARRGAFIAYLCAGDPDYDTSLAACRTLLAAGTDLLELGMPFSDPLADGLTNQLASERALASGGLHLQPVPGTDLVLALGKGHEQSMCFGVTEYAWDDRSALRAALGEHLHLEGENMPYLPAVDD